MSRSILLAALFALCIAPAGCDDKPATVPPSPSNGSANYQKTTAALLEKWRQVAQVLNGVKDQASAEAAATQLRAMRRDLVRIVGEFKELPRPTTRDVRRDQLGAALAEIKKQRDRIETEPQLSAAKDALDQLFQAMDVKGEE